MRRWVGRFASLACSRLPWARTDKDRLRRLWIDLLGLSLTGNYRSERENVDEDIAVVGRGAARVEVDLMQPVDVGKRPAVHDPALNHVGLWVDDLAAAVEWLAAKGVRFTPGGIRKGAGGFDVCFIHPKGEPGRAARGRGRADRARAGPRRT